MKPLIRKPLRKGSLVYHGTSADREAVMKKRTSRPRPEHLVPNAPDKRLVHVIKTYWKKYPQAVVDTVTVSAFLVGLDLVAPPLLSNDRWERWDFKQMLGATQPFVMNVAAADLIPELERVGALPQIFPVLSQFANMNAGNLASPADLRRFADQLNAMMSRSDWDLLRLAGFVTQFPAHSDADFLIPWVARELVVTWKDARDVDEYSDAGDLLETKAPAIAQWAKETRTDINKVNLAQALDAIARYRFKTAHGPQGVVVYRFADGWTVQDLRAEKELRAEGKNLVHCVGGYGPAVENGESRIYSLRDPEGRPFVTMEWQTDLSPGDGGPWGDYIAMTAEQFGSDKPLAVSLRKRGRFHQVFGMQNCELSGAGCLPWLNDFFGDVRAEELLLELRARVAEFIREKFHGEAYGLLLAGIPARDIDWNGVELDEDMEWVDLSGVDLRRVIQFGLETVFNKAEGANFSGLKLQGSRFKKVAGAKFVKTHLYDADFHGADCRGADFTGADLRNADFTDLADLEGADLSGILIDSETRFRSADGINVTLKQLQHWGNDLGIDLYRVFGKDRRDGFVTGVGYDFVYDDDDGLWKTQREFDDDYWARHEAPPADEDEPEDDDDE